MSSGAAASDHSSRAIDGAWNAIGHWRLQCRVGPLNPAAPRRRNHVVVLAPAPAGRSPKGDARELKLARLPSPEPGQVGHRAAWLRWRIDLQPPPLIRARSRCNADVSILGVIAVTGLLVGATCSGPFQCKRVRSGSRPHAFFRSITCRARMAGVPDSTRARRVLGAFTGLRRPGSVTEHVSTPPAERHQSAQDEQREARRSGHDSEVVQLHLGH